MGRRFNGYSVDEHHRLFDLAAHHHMGGIRGQQDLDDGIFDGIDKHANGGLNPVVVRLASFNVVGRTE